MASHFLIEGPGGVSQIKLQGGYNSALPITTTGLITGGSGQINGNLTVTGTLSAGAETVTSQVITAAAANAFTVGANGTTNPTFNVDTSTASVATGLNVKGAAAASGVALSVLSSGTNENLTIDAKGSGTISLNSTATGAVVIGPGGSRLAISSTSANALAVGANGSVNPALQVDASTASSATGLKVKSAAAASGVALSVVSSGTNEGLTLDAKGSGTVVVGATSTGQVSIGRGSVSTVILSSTIASLGTTQNSTPTAAQLLGGVVTQTGSTGAGTVTLPTGTQLSTAVPGVAVGDTFVCTFANLGGAQTLTITGATGSTVVGNAAVASGKNSQIMFVNTGANTWNVYVVVSA